LATKWHAAGVTQPCDPSLPPFGAVLDNERKFEADAKHSTNSSTHPVMLTYLLEMIDACMDQCSVRMFVNEPVVDV